jgi:hypothetical protein
VRLPHPYNGRNKAFFFVAREGMRVRQGTQVTGTVPIIAAAAVLQHDGGVLLLNFPAWRQVHVNCRVILWRALENIKTEFTIQRFIFSLCLASIRCIITVTRGFWICSHAESGHRFPQRV